MFGAAIISVLLSSTRTKKKLFCNTKHTEFPIVLDTLVDFSGGGDSCGL